MNDPHRQQYKYLRGNPTLQSTMLCVPAALWQERRNGGCASSLKNTQDHIMGRAALNPISNSNSNSRRRRAKRRKSGASAKSEERQREQSGGSKTKKKKPQARSYHARPLGSQKKGISHILSQDNISVRVNFKVVSKESAT